MRKYPLEYLEILKKEKREIENDGLKIILKPSPGEEREWYLDPCEKQIIDGNWVGNFNQRNEDKKDIKKEKLSLDNIVSEIRDSMGFANYNLNTVEIYTKFETITDSGNEVGLWRYYPRHLENKKNNKALVFFQVGLVELHM